NPDGTAIATTTTNASGYYVYTGVEPAYYVVVETQPLYYSSISDYDITTGAFDLDGDDSAQGPDDNIPVRLLPGETDADNDFVDGRPGTICGNVKDDTGLPISGVQIKLYLDVNNNDTYDVGDVLIATAYTDGDTGNYCFEDVTPGEYVVVEIQPPFYSSVSDYDHSTGAFDPDGDDSSQGPDNEIPVTLVPNEQDVDNNFREDPFTGVISGYVNNDAASPISGVVIQLYNDTNADGNPDGVAIATTSTNTSGYYAFTGVEPGYYVVVETQPLYYSSISDYDITTGAFDLDGDDSAQGPDDNVPVRLLPGETDADNDFVDGRPGTICGNVKEDTGLPISSVQIKLYKDVNNNDAYDAGDVLIATVYTDGDTGNYCFEDVTPGEYVVVEIQPPFYNSVSDYDHSTGAFDPDGDDSADGPDNEVPVTLVPNEQDMDNKFIEDPFTGTISGYVNNEVGAALNNIVISLYNDTNADGNPDGVAIATTNTNASGYYAFTGVEPGYYVVVETQPLYYSSISDYDITTGAFDLDGDDSAQGPDDNIPVRLLPGETDADNDFVDGRPGTICGNVKDDTGLPISSVLIKLYKDVNNNDAYDAGDVLIATTSTDSTAGNYCFENVIPDEYVVVEIQPAFYNSVSDYDFSTGASDPDGDDSAQGPDNEIPVTLVPNEQDLDNNFIEDPFTGTISGYVNNDAGAPIPGVVIKLYNDTNADGNPDGTAIATTTTNASGYYVYTDVEPAYYVVVETQPLYYSSISDYDITTGAFDLDGDDSAQGPDDNVPVRLLPGETDADNDFVDGRPGTICGNVKDDTGLPISSVQIKLYKD
ncbi:MAG: SdrD B-like domain-containing protein, partial [Saprospiraceae bacterium]